MEEILPRYAPKTIGARSAHALSLRLRGTEALHVVVVVTRRGFH